MSKINREIGLIIGQHGLNVTIIDEMGNVLTAGDISAILSMHYLKYTDTKTIALPVNSSCHLSSFIESLGGSIKWIPTSLRNPEGCIDIFYKGAVKYPFLEQKYDPMITCLLILEFLTYEKKALYEILRDLPKPNLISTTIHCTFEEKASIMGMLSSETQRANVELIDGIKIYNDNSWILLLPDASLPLIHIYAEGETEKERDMLIQSYYNKIKDFRLNLIQ